MISRKSAIVLADTFVKAFKRGHRVRNNHYYTMHNDVVYDFLFAHDYQAWFCNLARSKCTGGVSSVRGAKQFVMQLHTGESVASATPKWSWSQREQLGQRYLRELAEDLLVDWQDYAVRKVDAEVCGLQRTLELDGYMLRDSRLIPPDTNVLNLMEETSVLQSLYAELELSNVEVILHHFELSEKHYIDGKWDDSISNSRKFLEAVLQETAVSHSLQVSQTTLPKRVYESPSAVRDYLEAQNLLETKEKKALASNYGLLSETGGHPYMAKNDQARLLRNIALTFAQFVMLRLRGRLSEPE